MKYYTDEELFKINGDLVAARVADTVSVVTLFELYYKGLITSEHLIDKIDSLGTWAFRQIEAERASNGPDEAA